MSRMAKKGPIPGTISEARQVLARVREGKSVPVQALRRTVMVLGNQVDRLQMQERATTRAVQLFQRG